MNAVAEGGLMFCEEDLIFDVDGWDEMASAAKEASDEDEGTVQFVAETEASGIERWLEENAIPRSYLVADFTPYS